jgi:hypothetical protein
MAVTAIRTISYEPPCRRSAKSVSARTQNAYGALVQFRAGVGKFLHGPYSIRLERGRYLKEAFRSLDSETQVAPNQVSPVALLAALAGPGFAHAADFDLYATARTIGFVVGVEAPSNHRFAARLAYTTYEYTVDDLDESDLMLDGKEEVGGVQPLLDWHPFGGTFRLSAGAIENALVSGQAEPMANYTLNGTRYSSAQSGATTGTTKYDSISPYAGIGFGYALSRDGQVVFSADLGVVFTGPLEVELNATCRVPNAMLCTRVQEDVLSDEAQLQRKGDRLKYWPVMSIGVSYRF